MTGTNAVSLSNFPKNYFPEVRLSAGKGFDNVGIGNGTMQAASPARAAGQDGGFPAARSTQPHEPAAGFPLHRAPSLESLFGPDAFGEMQQPSDLGDGIGMYGGAGGDGPQRADFLLQPDRSHPLDRGGQSPTYQLQHHKDVAHHLSPVTQQWDQQAGATIGLRTATGETPPGALFNEAQTQASNMSREQAARSVLSDLGVPRSEVDALLTRHANSAGGVAVLNACRLLSMTELKADAKARAALVKKLDHYLDADKGRYTGLYRAFGKDASKPLKELQASIDKTVDAIGHSVTKDRLLADSTAALVDALARKNPGMSSEALRSQLPDLINAQAFSAYNKRLDGATASGLLQDAELLPQLVQAAERPQPAPANKAADPVNDFAKHLVSVLGAIKLPDIHVENNARNIVNQDGWNFQGNKDPRPEPAVEVMPPTIKVLPEVDDTDAQSIDEGIDMDADDGAEVDKISLNEDEVEIQEVKADEERDDQPLRTTGRFGAPVHPLLGGLLSDLRQNTRYQNAANGGAHPNLEHLLAVHPDRTEEEEESAATRTHPDGAAPLEGLASGALRRPIPLGLHTRDMPELRRDDQA